MNKKIILILILILILIIIAGFVVYPVVSSNNIIEDEQNIAEEQEEELAPFTLEEEQALIEDNYPVEMSGIIKFLAEEGGSIATSDGQEYIFSPAESIEVYKSLGMKNGQNISIRARILEDNYIKWILVK